MDRKLSMQAATRKHKGRRGKAGRIAALCVVVVIVALCVVAYAITAREMAKNFGRASYPDPRYTAAWRYDHYAAEFPRRAVSFPSGGNTLRGYVYCPDNDGLGLIVFAHGIGGGHENYLDFIAAFLRRGWCVLAYDATGSCESEGTGTMGLSQSALDLDAALTFAESSGQFDGLPVVVMGHSWGGYAAAAVLSFGHDVRASVSLAGYATPYAELAETCDRMFGGVGVLLHPFIWLYNKAQFGRYAGLSAVSGISGAGIPVLVVHGTADQTIRFDGAAIIARRDRITNPAAQYLVMDTPGQDGHNGILYSPQYAQYREQVLVPRQDTLSAQYGDDVPDDVREQFYSSVDKELYNSTNEQLVSYIDHFLQEAIAKNSGFSDVQEALR